jgi:hypothetical protein
MSLIPFATVVMKENFALFVTQLRALLPLMRGNKGGEAFKLVLMVARRV